MDGLLSEIQSKPSCMRPCLCVHVCFVLFFQIV